MKESKKEEEEEEEEKKKSCTINRAVAHEACKKVSEQASEGKKKVLQRSLEGAPTHKKHINGM
jgi:hypothetical protein